MDDPNELERQLTLLAAWNREDPRPQSAVATREANGDVLVRYRRRAGKDELRYPPGRTPGSEGKP